MLEGESSKRSMISIETYHSQQCDMELVTELLQAKLYSEECSVHK